MTGGPRPVDVRLVGVHLRKHAEHSGYDRLADHLPAAHRSPRRRPAGGSPSGGGTRVLRAASGLLWYTGDELALEASTVVRRALVREAVDHYLYGERQLWLSLLAPRRRSHRIVATFHQPAAWLHRAVRRPQRLARLDAMIVVSDYQKPSFARFVGTDRVFVVPHGVDVDHFRPAPRAPASRPLTCLTVSDWLRDVDTLDRVITLLGREHGAALRFVVMTRSAQTRRRLAGRPGVRLLTDVTDGELLRHYQDADLLLLPLLDATANNVLLEALACGTPVVATAVGGVGEYLDGDCGRLTPPGDADAMARAVTELVADPERLAVASRAARRRAMTYDWTTVAADTWRVYEAVLDG